MRVLLALSVLCATFAQYVLVGSAGQWAPTGFKLYPGYAGPLVINGTVTFTADGLSHNVSVDLRGAEMNGTVSVHIHSGVSCDNASAVGGHLWKPFADVDPWAVITLPADSTGLVLGDFVINFGYDKTDFVRHALVVHNSTGGRVACAIIHDENLTAIPAVLSATTLGTYVNYTGPLTVRGQIDVWDVLGSELQVNYRLTGLPANSTGGLHVHVGFDCDSAGGHYWLPANETDPWSNLTVAAWHSNDGGLAEGTFHLAAGVSQSDVMYRAVVVHDNNGTRVACGLLGGAMPSGAPTDAPSVASLAPSTSPSAAPSVASLAPSTGPSAASLAPSTGPSAASLAPSPAPSASLAPTVGASEAPSAAPSVASAVPSAAPSAAAANTTAPTVDLSGASAAQPLLGLMAVLCWSL